MAGLLFNGPEQEENSIRSTAFWSKLEYGAVAACQSKLGFGLGACCDFFIRPLFALFLFFQPVKEVTWM